MALVRKNSTGFKKSCCLLKHTNILLFGLPQGTRVKSQNLDKNYAIWNGYMYK